MDQRHLLAPLRSSRCNKYDGFKPTNFSDSKKAKSKVKPRKATSTLNVASDEDTVEEGNAIVMAHVPDHTTIHVLQAIGINLCGVPLKISLLRRC
jgi:hypothetical protein